MSAFRFFSALVLLSFLCLTTEAQNATYLTDYCFDTGNFTRNSTYQSNLNTLLSALSSEATFTNGFYNKAASGENPNRVYGLFLCRGDVSATACRNCVTFAARNVSQLCPVEKNAVLWYDECLLRYADIWTFTVNDQVWFGFPNDQNVADPTRFNDVVATSMYDARTRAASVAKRFATKEANISGVQTLYSLVQCTPDLSSSDCDRCLQAAIAGLPSCCSGKTGGRILYPSCYVRYEVYPFYNVSAVAAPPLPIVTNPGSEINRQGMWIPIAVSSLAVLGLTFLSSFAFIIWRRRNAKDKENSQEVQLLELGARTHCDFSTEHFQGEQVGGSQEFPSIQLDIINVATKHFSEANKLGEGGFGPVYKGTLADGKEIAVKRLSRTSGQGLLEFKNEVMLIARLQHKNLVRLLGCCLEDNETLLVYEYLPNRSLDVFLFDARMSMQLDWPRRFSIITGIARGILYLHEDSRLKIIHRDLKASNILLDSEMNPKISDFGMARIFGGNQSQANTNRVVGTYGYMAPEYAMEGLFSVKSDVFSFGVLLLEIICGKKNNGFYFYERGQSLLTFAWKLWSNGQGMQLIDPQLVHSCVEFEVLKCIHIGLLCVQKDPMHRPPMSSVIVMLANETITLPKPTEPAFFVGRVAAEPALPSADNIVCSVNEVTLSDVSPR